MKCLLVRVCFCTKVLEVTKIEHLIEGNVLNPKTKLMRPESKNKKSEQIFHSRYY